MNAVLDSVLEQRPTIRQSQKLGQLLRAFRSLPRRQGRRLAVRQRVRFRLDQGPFQGAELQDVGPQGMRLVLPSKVPEGSRLQVLYPRPQGGDHWVEGEVRWSRKLRSQHEVGLELEFRSQHDRNPFEELVRTLSQPAPVAIPPQPEAQEGDPWYLNFLEEAGRC